MNSIDDIKAAHKGHFFSPETMRFWRSRVHGTVYPIPGHGALFTTSESGAHGGRYYSVRYCDLDGNISTVGPFLAANTRCQAIQVARTLQKSAIEQLESLAVSGGEFSIEE